MIHLMRMVLLRIGPPSALSQQDHSVQVISAIAGRLIGGGLAPLSD
jgi:hypothetical protein